MPLSRHPVHEITFGEVAFPLSLVQQEIWIDQALNPDSPHYNTGAVFLMGGSVMHSLLEDAINRVANAHDAMRISITVTPDGPRQRVLAAVDVPLRFIDLSAHSESQSEAEALIGRHCSGPFKSFDGPLWDNLLIRVSKDRHYWVHRHHHLACDGSSIAMMAREVESVYNGLLQGRPADPVPGVSYLEYLDEERAYLDSRRFQSDKAFWQERLRQLPPPVFERPSTAGGSHGSGRVQWRLARPLYERLSEIATEQRVTVAHAFLAIIAIYFARVRNLDEVVVGVPLHNRPPRHKSTLGLFAKVLPVGIRLDRRQSFAELIASVAVELRRCYRHQRFPLSRIEHSARPAQAGNGQMFDLTFSLEEFFHHYRFGDEDVIPSHMDHGHEPMGLAVSVAVAGESDDVVIDLDHDYAILSNEQVEVVRERLACLLDASVRQPHAPVSKLPIMSRSDELQLEELAFGPAVAREPALAHRQFEARVRERPGAIAYLDGDAATTYRQLNARSNQVAHWLVARGVKSDDLVAVCLRRGPDLVAALLGVLKAGAAYVPLDPDYPSDRLAYMLANSSPRALISQRNRGCELDASTLCDAVLWLDDEAELAALPSSNPEVGGILPEHLAYVIYTSGSTGRPKGAMLEHRNLSHQIAVHREVCALGPGDRMLQFASVSFDSAIVEIFPTLSAGGCLVGRPDWLHAPDQRFVQFLHEQSISVLDLPTAFWAAWTHLVEAGQCIPGPALRSVVVGGEEVQPRHLSAWLACARTRGLRWINTYGPTETTVYSTALAYEPDSEGVALSIGRPVDNTEVRIIDDAGEPVPPGVVGEIWIAGAGVARGYLGRDELTRRSFVMRTGSDGMPRRFYRTGDQGLWRSDGNLSFLGRNDFQVKIRGHRIELGEIQARLGELDCVHEAVVVALDDEQGLPALVAYVVPAVNTWPRPSELRDRLAQSLAAHMLPAQYVLLPALPMTPNGKVDCKALPRPDDSSRAVREFQAPEGHAEQVLASLWCELFGLERVGRLDQFFELGGHSLGVIELIERLRRAGFDTDIRSVFDAPNLAALATRLQPREPLARQSAMVPANGIVPGARVITPQMLPLLELTQAEIDRVVSEVPGGAENVQDIYPLAALQEGMLFHHLLEQQGDAYLMQSILVFDDRARLDAFLAALQLVIDRHDILRTAMHWQGVSAPVQVVQRDARLPVQECVLDPGKDAAMQLRSLTDPRNTRLDLRRAPLMAAWTARQPGSARWLLALLDHHIVCDHFTLELILDEVRQVLAGEQANLPEAVPYRNYIAQSRAVPEVDHERYFRGQLADVTDPTAPFGLHEVLRDGSGVEEARQALTEELSTAIRACARRYKVSPAVFFHLAWARVVGASASREDVVFGTVLSGRLQGGDGASRVLGMFLNTLPLRLRLEGLDVVQGLLHTRDQLGELLEHEQASLALALRCSGVTTGAPLFAALFNYRHSTITRQDGVDELELAELEGMRVLSVEERTNYPLGVSVDDHGAAFALTVQCLPEIDARRVVQAVCKVVDGLLEALKTSPRRLVMDLEVVGECERTQLAAFNGARQPLPAQDTLHGLFEAQVARTPDACALVFGAQKRSYAQLDAEANRMAAMLRQEGVVGGDRVAICLPRGIEIVVAILGVLKAGAAYIPMDPSYPPERLSYMLADSSPRVLVADAEGLPGWMQSCQVPVLRPDLLRDGTVVASAAARNPRGQSGSDVAYVIYTSGSTGQPKGVVVEHGGTCNLVQAQGELFGVGADSHVLQFASFSFDASVSEWAMTLCRGGCLHVAEREALMPGDALFATLRAGGITHVTLPSSALAAFGEAAAAALPPMTVIAAGDALPGSLARQWARWHRLFNAYGPTEATVCATAHLCTVDEPDVVPIGRPIANVQIHVLDGRGQLVPRGAVGEICIGGAGVARGYLNRPELTRERFIDDRFAGAPPARLYRTGDLGRWRTDGTLEFVGRNDQQIKIRGFRIEPGEIEAKLRLVPHVRDAAVIAHGDVAGDRRLVAYLVGDSAELSVQSARDKLARELPEYMVPAAFVVLPMLPLSANGKLDRAALPAPDRAAATGQVYTPVVGATEAGLAELWQALLGVDRIGRDDHFFELGGHSLLAVSLVSHVREQLGVEMALKQVFDQPRLRDMAAWITSAQLEQFSEEDLQGFATGLDGLSATELMALLTEESEG